MNRNLAGLLVAFAVLAMFSFGCSQHVAPPPEPRTVGDTIDDASITASVKVALAFERGVKATEINVDTRGGTVTLSGTVGTEAERQLARKVAEDVDGVKEILNRLEVRG